MTPGCLTPNSPSITSADGKCSQLFDSAGRPTGTAQDLSGRTIEQDGFSGSFGAQYVQPIGSMNWFTEIDVNFIDDYLMTGEKLLVSDALSADIIIVLATIDTHPVFVIVESHMLKPQDLHPRTLIDETKRAADISLQNIIIEETQIMHASHEIVRVIKLLGSLLMPAESVGVISITLKTIVDYLTTRKQFGKLIGSYQSLKHPTVEILLEMDLFLHPYDPWWPKHNI